MWHTDGLVTSSGAGAFQEFTSGEVRKNMEKHKRGEAKSFISIYSLWKWEERNRNVDHRRGRSSLFLSLSFFFSFFFVGIENGIDVLR